MSLYLFLIVVTALACGSVEPLDVPAKQSILASLAMVLAFGLIAKSAATLAAARVQRGVAPRLASETLHCQLDLLRWVSLAVSLFCLLGFRLAAASGQWPVIGDSMCLRSLVLLSPAISMLALTLWVERQYGVALQQEAAGVWRGLRQVASTLVSAVGWIVVPILLMLALSDTLGLILQRWLPQAEPLAGGVTALALVLVVVPLLVPWLAKRLWRTRPLDAAEHAWIGRLVARVGPPIEVRLWDTSMRTSNAVVIGFFPGFRTLLVTDRLLAELPADQLRLIILHELAHVRRGHLWLRIAAVAPAWLAAAMLVQWLGDDPLIGMLAQGTAILLTLVLLRWAAHATEFDADRIACQLAVGSAARNDYHVSSRPGGRSSRRSDGARSDGAAVPASAAGEAMNEAMQEAVRLSSALRAVTADSAQPPRRSSWLHPSVEARCHRLSRWAANQHRQVAWGT